MNKLDHMPIPEAFVHTVRGELRYRTQETAVTQVCRFQNPHLTVWPAVLPMIHQIKEFTIRRTTTVVPPQEWLFQLRQTSVADQDRRVRAADS